MFVSSSLPLLQVKIYFALMHLHPLDVRITYRGTPGSDVQDAEELTLSTMAQLNDARYTWADEIVFFCVFCAGCLFFGRHVPVQFSFCSCFGSFFGGFVLLFLWLPLCEHLVLKSGESFLFPPWCGPVRKRQELARTRRPRRFFGEGYRHTAISTTTTTTITINKQQRKKKHLSTEQTPLQGCRPPLHHNHRYIQHPTPTAICHHCCTAPIENKQTRLCLNALQLEHAFGGRAVFAEVMLKHYKFAFLSQVRVKVKVKGTCGSLWYLVKILVSWRSMGMVCMFI